MFNDSLRFFWEEVLKKDKVLAAMLSSVFFAVAVQNAFSGIIVGLSVIITGVLSAVICTFLSKFLPEDSRLFVFMSVNGIIVTIICIFMENIKVLENYTFLETFIPICAISCGNLVCINRPWTVRTIKNSLKDSVKVGAISAIFVITYGLFREILGYGNIFGIKIPVLENVMNNFAFFRQSCGGFVLMGLIAALLQKITSNRLSGGNG